jgi:hypothetical protein
MLIILGMTILLSASASKHVEWTNIRKHELRDFF